MSKKISSRPARKKPNDQSISAVKMVIAGLSLLALAWYINWDASKVSEPIADADILRQGGRVFQQNCAVCHGENGEGHAEVAQAPALDASEHAWHHPDGQLQEIIQKGGTQMPGFEDMLSNDEIIAVIRYFQTLWRPDQLQVQQSKSLQYPLR